MPWELRFSRLMALIFVGRCVIGDKIWEWTFLFEDIENELANNFLKNLDQRLISQTRGMSTIFRQNATRLPKTEAKNSLSLSFFSYNLQ